MARCGCTGSGICDCTITAGTGTTVTGTGSTLDPYIITTDPEVGEITVADTATVNLTVTGDGSGATPWLITADVVAEGVEDIIGAAIGTGLEYDDGADKINALISIDANNALTLGSDDGLYVEQLNASAINPFTDYVNGFEPYTSLIGTTYYDPAAFIEPGADHVRLRGRIITDGTPAAGQTIADLPVDAVPARIVQISVPADDGTQVALDITPAGEIICQTTGTYTSISLDGVTYYNADN